MAEIKYSDWNAFALMLLKDKGVLDAYHRTTVVRMPDEALLGVIYALDMALDASTVVRVRFPFRGEFRDAVAFFTTAYENAMRVLIGRGWGSPEVISAAAERYAEIERSHREED